MKTLSTFDIVAKEGNCRNSEGSFVTLKDGRILFIYTRYAVGHGGDHDNADLASCYSSDGGLTWSHGGIVMKREETDLNIMSVSLLRLRSGRILLFFLRKTLAADGSVNCVPCCCHSEDEGESWTVPEKCLKNDAYYVVNNDRLVQMSDGRIAFPAALHPWRWVGDHREYRQSMAFYCYSEDEGKSWVESPSLVFPMTDSGSRTGWQEPGILELDPGKILMWLRNDLGCQYKCYSHDGGETWSNPCPAPEFKSPASPLSMKRDPLDGSLVAVWDDMSPRWGTTLIPGYTDRRPLVLARSYDNGRTWKDHQMLENEPAHGYCYIGIHFLENGRLLLSYCCGLDGYHHNILMDTRIRLLER